jgi:hypothetical protein
VIPGALSHPLCVGRGCRSHVRVDCLTQGSPTMPQTLEKSELLTYALDFEKLEGPTLRDAVQSVLQYRPESIRLWFLSLTKKWRLSAENVGWAGRIRTYDQGVMRLWSTWSAAELARLDRRDRSPHS